MTECNKSVYLASKSIDMIDAVNKGYADGYNKAIDDFVKMAYEAYVSQAIEYNAKNFAEQYGDIAGITPEYEGSW